MFSDHVDCLYSSCCLLWNLWKESHTMLYHGFQSMKSIYFNACARYTAFARFCAFVFLFFFGFSFNIEFSEWFLVSGRYCQRPGKAISVSRNWVRKQLQPNYGNMVYICVSRKKNLFYVVYPLGRCTFSILKSRNKVKFEMMKLKSLFRTNRINDKTWHPSCSTIWYQQFINASTSSCIIFHYLEILIKYVQIYREFSKALLWHGHIFLLSFRLVAANKYWHSYDERIFWIQKFVITSTSMWSTMRLYMNSIWNRQLNSHEKLL